MSGHTDFDDRLREIVQEATQRMVREAVDRAVSRAKEDLEQELVSIVASVAADVQRSLSIEKRGLTVSFTITDRDQALAGGPHRPHPQYGGVAQFSGGD